MDEHYKIISEMIGEHYDNILDLGSGKTSMGTLLRIFPNSSITGICYPGDNRKLDSIRANCEGKFELIELDICKEQPKEKFDLVLSHLLLGETIKFGNVLDTMLRSIFSLDTKQFCIIDYLEDIDVDFEFVKKIACDYGYVLIKEKIFPKEEPQQFSKFIGENYIGLLFNKE